MAFWAVSDLEQEWFRNAGVANVSLVPNGVEPRHALPALTDQPHFVFVGSLGGLFNRQGVEWFLTNAWPLVKRRLPGATLTIVGAGGEEEDGEGWEG